jgi:hypothetical protein
VRRKKIRFTFRDCLAREEEDFPSLEKKKVGRGKGGSSEGRKSFEIQSDLVAIVENDRGWGIV